MRGEARFWRAFLDRVRGALDGQAVSDSAFGRIAAHFRDPVSWALYDDVTPALDRLAGGGYLLGVVSNWDSHLPRLLEGLGLLSRFQTVTVSAIEETGKPGAEIFRRTCARLDVAPGEALHVGDSMREDVEGARAAGLFSLLLDRNDRHPMVEPRIESLAEVPEMLMGARADGGPGTGDRGPFGQEP